MGATAALSAAVRRANQQRKMSSGIWGTLAVSLSRMWVKPPRKQCRRIDERWHAHYLTFSCFRRQPFFRGRQSPQWFLECLDAARQSAGFDLWAYVVMPEHVHLVVFPHDGVNVSDILYRIKRPMTTKVLTWVLHNSPAFLSRMAHQRADGRITHHFWQAGGGYDRNLWSPEEIYEKIRYVHENPVRRKLVTTATEWRWSSDRAWETGQEGQIALDLDSLPDVGS